MVYIAGLKMLYLEVTPTAIPLFESHEGVESDSSYNHPDLLLWRHLFDPLASREDGIQESSISETYP